MIDDLAIPSQTISPRGLLTGTIFFLGLTAYAVSIASLIFEFEANGASAIGAGAGGLLMGSMARPIIMGKYSYGDTFQNQDLGLLGLGMAGAAIAVMSFAMAHCILNADLDRSILTGVATVAMVSLVGYLEYRLHKSATGNKLNI